MKEFVRSGPTTVHDLVEVDGMLYFSTSGMLWKSDGTTEGTVVVSETVRSPFELTAFRGALYFSAEDDVHGRELWKSDGTEEGTILVKDVNIGRSWGLSTYDVGDGFFVVGTAGLTAFDDALYFFASDGAAGAKLWKSDGTEDGTAIVSQIPTWESFSVPEFASVGNTLFFAASDDLHGRELWKTDGTASGTVLVKDTQHGISSGLSGPELTGVGDSLFFVVGPTHDGGRLWVSDGTTEGTNPVTSNYIQASGLANFQETLVFDYLISMAGLASAMVPRTVHTPFTRLDQILFLQTRSPLHLWTETCSLITAANCGRPTERLAAHNRLRT